MSHVFTRFFVLSDSQDGPDVPGDDVCSGPIIISGTEQIDHVIAIDLLDGEKSSELNNTKITNMQLMWLKILMVRNLIFVRTKIESNHG